MSGRFPVADLEHVVDLSRIQVHRRKLLARKGLPPSGGHGGLHWPLT